MGAKTPRKVRIGAIFACKVLLEAIFGPVLGGRGGGKLWGLWAGHSTPNSTPNSMANSRAIPRLISEAKTRKSLEIVENNKNLRSVF